jgi:sugar phosphate isomerase/epimerase
MAVFQINAFADEASVSLAGQIEACLENGVRGIEMRGVNGKSVVDLSDEEAAAAREQVESAGLVISAMGSPFGKISITDDFAPHLAKFERGLALCELLGVQRMRIFSFYIPEGQDPALYRDEVLRRMDQMLTAAEKAGVFCAHENEKGIYGDNDARCLDLLQHFRGRMGGIFDPANFIQCGVSPQAALPGLYPYLSWLHVKDAFMEDGSVVPAGQGDGAIPEVLAQLGDFGGALHLTVEPHLTIFEGLSALQSETLNHRFHYPDSRAAFRAAVGALKNLLTQQGYKEEEHGLWTR